MGAVYLAEQLSIGRKVALKVLQREFAMNDEFIKRFHQEARLAPALTIDMSLQSMISIRPMMAACLSQLNTSRVKT